MDVFPNYPNNALDTLTEGVISLVSDSVVAPFEGHKSCAITISGTWVGTLNVQTSKDNGVTYTNGWFSSVNQSAVAAGAPTPFNAITANGSYISFNTGGITHFKVKPSVWTSGTAAVVISMVEAAPTFTYVHGAVFQHVALSVSNNSIANLAAGASFTGLPENTLGIAGIQVNFKASQTCLLCCQQSTDGTNWDIDDEWRVLAGAGDGRTFQATSSYFRLIVTNEGLIPTTYLRLQIALCPIVEALPKALSQGGGLLTTPVDTLVPTWRGKVTPDGDVKVTTLGAPALFVRFSQDFFDSYYLNDFLRSGGTRSNQAGTCRIVTPTGDATAVATIWTKKASSVPVGKVSTVYFTLKFTEPTLVNNQRRWGLGLPPYDSGVYFELLDGVLYATSIFDGTTTRVSIDYYKPTDENFYRYDIQLTSYRANFFVNNVLVCAINKLGTSEALYSNTLLPLIVDNRNSGVTVAPAEIWVQAMSFYNSALASQTITDPYEMNAARVTKSSRLMVASTPEVAFSELFNGPLETTTKWEETLLVGGTAVKGDNYLSLTTSLASGSSVTELSRQPIQPGSVAETFDFYCTLNITNQYEANNIREWGVKADADCGYFFRLTGNTLETVVVKQNVEVVTTVGYDFFDDKFHAFTIKMLGAMFVWFYVDDQQVDFRTANGNQLLVDETVFAAYFKNYNTGIVAAPVILMLSSAYLLDNNCQTTTISGKDTAGLSRAVKVDTQGRFFVAPFESIQTALTYSGDLVTKTEETDVYGGVLTTNFTYTGKRVTSISQSVT